MEQLPVLMVPVSVPPAWCPWWSTMSSSSSGSIQIQVQGRGRNQGMKFIYNQAGTKQKGVTKPNDVYNQGTLLNHD